MTHSVQLRGRRRLPESSRVGIRRRKSCIAYTGRIAEKDYEWMQWRRGSRWLRLLIAGLLVLPRRFPTHPSDHHSSAFCHFCHCPVCILYRWRLWWKWARWAPSTKNSWKIVGVFCISVIVAGVGCLVIRFPVRGRHQPVALGQFDPATPSTARYSPHLATHHIAWPFLIIAIQFRFLNCDSFLFKR